MQTYQLFVFLIFITSCICDDWTSTCPSSCMCKWANGKKSVICDTLELTTIPTTLSTEIQVLSLNENNIVKLNREEFTILGLVNLQRIFLKKSKIRLINRDAFKNLKILVELDLSENAIEQLDKHTFNGNDRLRMLYLYGNPLKKLMAYQFPVLPHLRSLDLHNCQINTIDATAFVNLELLELLDLKNNLLENLYENVFQHMNNLKTLQLDGNPWKCNCKLRNFRNWYIINSKLSKKTLLCKNPVLLRNKQWDLINEIQFGCSPIVDVFSDDIYNVDIGSNITFSCLIAGDPLPHVTWDFNGKEFDDNDNLLIEEAAIIGTDKLWKNLTILNITNYDAGIYVCSATNNIGQQSKNITIYLAEVVQHVIEKGPETFWYFGLILGTFGTVFGLIILSFLICLCKKTTQRRRSIKHIKGSVSFNDQEKKLLDLSITTNDRQDSCEIAHTPSNVKTESVLANIEPVQIIIENNRTTSSSTTTTTASSSIRRHNNNHNNNNNNNNNLNNNNINSNNNNNNNLNNNNTNLNINCNQNQSQNQNHNHNDEFPLNVGVFPPPPPEFCSNVLTTTNPSPYGNIFISVSLTQDTLDNNPDMYPDLLNIPNRVMGKLFPINVSSYATLPRNNRHQRPTQNDNNNNNNNNNKRLQNVINYQNLETNHLNNENIVGSGGGSGGGGGGTISLCAGCLKNQDQYNNNNNNNNTTNTVICGGGGGGSGINVGGVGTSGIVSGGKLGKCGIIISGGGNCIGDGTINNNNCGGSMSGCGGVGDAVNSKISVSDIKKTDGKLLYPKYDNMGRRITASGNSTISLPDEEEQIDKEINFRIDENSNDGGGVPSGCDYVSL